jgi:hypothetical protein
MGTDVKLLFKQLVSYSALRAISSISPPPISCAENKICQLIVHVLAVNTFHFVSIRSGRFRASTEPTLHFAYIASIHLSTPRLREILISIPQASFIPFSPSPFPTHFQRYIFISATSLPRSIKNLNISPPPFSCCSHFRQSFIILCAYGRCIHSVSITFTGATFVPHSEPLHSIMPSFMHPPQHHTA